MTKKPVIGITIDYEEGGIDKYAITPYYVIRQNYIDAVTNAGGIAILIPNNLNALDDYVNMVDGMIFSGGDFDMPPSLYNEEPHPKTVYKYFRTDFEIPLFKKFLKTKKPILGICAGMQLMNIIFNGSLIQHIPDIERSNPVDHGTPKEISKILPRHDIKIYPKTKYGKICGTEKSQVNSTHHQSVKNISENIAIAAMASDGLIEAIEIIDHPFAIGVQWHPEYHVTENDQKLFKAFIKAANDKNTK